MIWRIEVATRTEYNDAAGRAAREDLADAGLLALSEGRYVRVFTIEGGLSAEDAERIARELLADPITDRFAINAAVDTGLKGNLFSVEVAKKPGVMDPVEASTLKGLADMGLRAEAVSTARKYVFTGACREDDFRAAAAEVLANEVIEECHFGEVKPSPRAKVAPYAFKRVEVDLLHAADAKLTELS